MNKKKAIISLCILMLISLAGIGIYKTYSYHKIQSKKEAYFDHFMNYWYSFYEQYNSDVELYTRMKKSIIIDYIKNGQGRYIYEQLPLYGGGSFSMQHHFNIDQELGGWWIAHKAVGPIECAPDSRKEERWAFWHMYHCGRELSRIDDYDERLALDMDYLAATFNKIDSLADEIHRAFYSLDRYRTTKVQNTDLKRLNYISDSEYQFDNY